MITETQIQMVIEACKGKRIASGGYGITVQGEVWKPIYTTERMCPIGALLSGKKFNNLFVGIPSEQMRVILQAAHELGCNYRDITLFSCSFDGSILEMPQHGGWYEFGKELRKMWLEGKLE